jgi:hypothetical protein
MGQGYLWMMELNISFNYNNNKYVIGDISYNHSTDISLKT